jgi:hypothetical protein
MSGKVTTSANVADVAKVAEVANSAVSAGVATVGEVDKNEEVTDSDSCGYVDDNVSIISEQDGIPRKNRQFANVRINISFFIILIVTYSV